MNTKIMLARCIAKLTDEQLLEEAQASADECHVCWDLSDDMTTTRYRIDTAKTIVNLRAHLARGHADESEEVSESDKATFTIYADDGEYQEVAESVAQALEQFSARRPDCFVSAVADDGMMPRLVLEESKS